jgi:hypothetical protein
VIARAVIASEAKQSSLARKERSWIASSQGLLAMTKEGCYSASDQGKALFLMDCRVISYEDALRAFARQ